MERLKNYLLSTAVGISLLASLWSFAVDRTTIKDREEANSKAIEALQSDAVSRREFEMLAKRLDSIDGKLDHLMTINQDVIWIHRPARKRSEDKSVKHITDEDK